MNYNSLGGFKPSKKKENKYIGRFLKQLTGVLILLLILILFKYTKTNVGVSINTTIKDNFYADYTDKAYSVFKEYSPEVKSAVETFVNKVENN